MKAVILAGGLGTRMREETEFRPKPMVEVGGRPILWHIMKILGSQGITEFIICAGYKSEYIKNYFMNYGASNSDFTIRLGDQESVIFHGSHDEFDWSVTVADTGGETMTGGRIKRIERYLDGEDFLCTYGDGIADIDLAALQETHSRSGKIATVTVAQPTSRFGVVDIDNESRVSSFSEKPKGADWVNIGYFIFKTQFLNYLDNNSILEEHPMRRLVEDQQLNAYRHYGFWQPMDTIREAAILNSLWSSGDAPWKVWN